MIDRRGGSGHRHSASASGQPAISAQAEGVPGEGVPGEGGPGPEGRPSLRRVDSVWPPTGSVLSPVRGGGSGRLCQDPGSGGARSDPGYLEEAWLCTHIFLCTSVLFSDS